MSPSKRKMVAMEQDLQRKVAKTIEQDSQKEENKRTERRNWYGTILSYMIERYNATDDNIFQFVNNFNTPGANPEVNINPQWLAYWFDREFKPYCEDLGVSVTSLYNGSTVKKKYEHEPAKTMSVTKKHQMIQITMKTTKK